jgi:hypothetical protein
MIISLIMMLVMAMCMSLAMAVPKSFIIFLIFVFPVVAITEYRLAIIAFPVLGILSMIYIVVQIGPGVIDNYFIPPVQVVGLASDRQ